MGLLEVDLFALCLTRQLLCFYSWRPDSETEATDTFMQNWVEHQWFANAPWWINNTNVEDSAMVPTSFGTSRGFSLEDTSPTRPGNNPSGTGIPDEAKGTPTSHLGLSQAVLFIMWVFSTGFSPHACITERQNYLTAIKVPHSQKGLASVNKGVEIHFLDYRGCCKFPSWHTYSEGYQ